jgi:hypothetical protein
MERFGTFKPLFMGAVLLMLLGCVQAAERQEILFVGTTINHTEGTMPGAPSYWMVKVDWVLLGPQPCGDIIRVTTFQSTAPPWGSADPEVKAGDKVWVSGSYREDGGCSVTLQGSEEYYLRKYPDEIKFEGLALGHHNTTLLGGGPQWSVKVEKVISGPEPCSDQLNITTSAALYPFVWGSVEEGIREGDRLEVFAAYHPAQDRCWATLYGWEKYYIKKIRVA